ncbi:30S ribosomal protein S13 [Candidatus Giovannonibacteria bacterium RIFCSPHIGHO2_02_43_13]|uniref:Small ribosomal subunit protein uS13 n=1 Tax=Candidatus Giovannonibacteria bacterium RIFCSPHIGHO2_02_43_13 TaxID=1798330 RepID=A0A1F5WPQ8_9BACT|nr:MAG: 30S ribosomal protein S13 [Parcubacteria group bacterium GW2011_GWA2_44_13]OGF72364.1 MAG: 30S ribosomal protein S13 [Candidatus Giovannonibacteria bacterium RIFCSPHIGHO2_12_FULL_44_42]OGF77639.1 MAG: 30S ribosomal protein S13 [Candidatus Giovannonibacteria bacterium RIFCSPHIGHO2_02_43_13]OGF88608.1 MAG: 30S ribosomal protein S13 [Candidatus Giovannonibacteria bacterium RIFCSPLOWO2_02_FULL_43_54]OGF97007.1 MAG: 30S ribosomal protein S13 [Candidatus Giovannonibacteria bacterium RIFCSPLOW
MVRIAGINLPDNKKIPVALSYIYGVGVPLAMHILNEAKVDIGKRAKDLSPQEVNKLRDIIEKKYTVEGDLRREITLNIKRLKDINSYRGLRHKRNLPTRGQRTKTNSRTRRGNVRKTMMSGKRKMEKK